MPWLRLDDGFPEHRKVLELTRNERWTWLEVLSYCARQTNGGHIPKGISSTLRYATPSFLRKCQTIGLLDPHENGYKVHDWADYNPRDNTNAERQRRYRERHRQHESNGDVTEPSNADVTADNALHVTPPRRHVPVPNPKELLPAPVPVDNQETTAQEQARNIRSGNLEPLGAIIAGLIPKEATP